MPQWLRRALLALIVLLIAMQFFRPARTNPPIIPGQEITANLSVPPAVESIFERSCNDCHSYRTVWPRYGEVAPVSWLIAFDVSRGRKELNLSAWAKYSSTKQADLLKKMCEEVTEGEMPGTAYELMHAGAKLSGGDVKQVCDWTQSAK